MIKLFLYCFKKKKGAFKTKKKKKNKIEDIQMN